MLRTKKRFISIAVLLMFCLNMMFASIANAQTSDPQILPSNSINKNINEDQLNSLDDTMIKNHKALEGKWGKVAKYAAKLLKKWNSVINKIANKLPEKYQWVVKTYLGLKFIEKAIDNYVQVGDNIHNFLTAIVNDCLPSWLEWLTPLITAAIEIFIPV